MSKSGRMQGQIIFPRCLTELSPRILICSERSPFRRATEPLHPQKGPVASMSLWEKKILYRGFMRNYCMQHAAIIAHETTPLDNLYEFKPIQASPPRVDDCATEIDATRQQGNGVSHIPPRHPLHEGLV